MMKVAAIQMVSRGTVDNNLADARSLVGEAKKNGAQIALLPENFLSYTLKIDIITSRQQEMIAALADIARSNDIWLLAGTIPRLPHAEQNKPHTSCLVFDKEGRQVGQYNKMHLFDADVNDKTQSYRESAIYLAGDEPGIVETDWGRIGIAICYDLRFPEYFRLLVEKGVKIIFVPSAFTYVTGKAHWEILLRARAIENQCFIVAADQGGEHTPERRTWGHSMIVNPWGDIVASTGEGVGIVYADIDLSEVDELRKKMPVLNHRRM